MQENKRESNETINPIVIGRKNVLEAISDMEGKKVTNMIVVHPDLSALNLIRHKILIESNEYRLITLDYKIVSNLLSSDIANIVEEEGEETHITWPETGDLLNIFKITTYKYAVINMVRDGFSYVAGENVKDYENASILELEKQSTFW